MWRRRCSGCYDQVHRPSPTRSFSEPGRRAPEFPSTRGRCHLGVAPAGCRSATPSGYRGCRRTATRAFSRITLRSAAPARCVLRCLAQSARPFCVRSRRDFCACVRRSAFLVLMVQGVERAPLVARGIAPPGATRGSAIAPAVAPHHSTTALLFDRFPPCRAEGAGLGDRCQLADAAERATAIRFAGSGGLYDVLAESRQSAPSSAPSTAVVGAARTRSVVRCERGAEPLFRRDSARSSRGTHDS